MSFLRWSLEVVLQGLLIWFYVVASYSESRDTLSVLRQDLLSRQDKWIPPFQGNLTYINVSVSFSPISISDLDAASETLTVGAYFRISWKDEKLTWDPKNYSGFYLVAVNHHDIWVPPISLSNGVSNLGPVETNIPVVITSSGSISWQVSRVFKTICKINVTKYPFDTQKCKIFFAPTYGYTVNVALDDFDILPADKFLDENGEWGLLGVKKEIDKFERVVFAKFTLSLQRKPLYYIINFIFPMTLMSVLNSFVFLIPARSGEKLGFLMAVFVSHALFLNLIHQTMPPTSDSISRLSLYLALIEIQGFLTILCTIVVLGIHHRKETKENTTLQQTSQTIKKSCAFWSFERAFDCVCFVISLALAGSSFLILVLY